MDARRLAVTGGLYLSKRYGIVDLLGNFEV